MEYSSTIRNNMFARKKNLKEKSSGAVVFREEGSKIYYLLLDYGQGYWGFPKGNIEKGETEKQAAQREIKEETGLDNLNFLSGFKQAIKYSFQKNSDLISKTVVYFLAKASDKTVKISKEHFDFKWLPCQKAIKLINFEDHRLILEKANEFLLCKELGSLQRIDRK